MTLGKAPQSLEQQNKLLADRIRMLEAQVGNARARGSHVIPDRNADDFLGIDVGTFSIAWARLVAGELDDFGTLPLRGRDKKNETLGTARLELRSALPNLLTRWMSTGRPTVTTIEEPVSAGFRPAKAMGAFKVMIEEALLGFDCLVFDVRPNQWHGIVRSHATSEQLLHHRHMKKGKLVIDIKSLAAALADQMTPGSRARQQGGSTLLKMTQDECDAFFMATFARMNWSQTEA